MDELINDNYCVNCCYGEPQNDDEWGNCEYIRCMLKNKDMANDDVCEKFI